MLKIENLGIEFNGNWLIRGASYQFLPGERIGLIGRNGTGKSTLLRMLDGQFKPTEGKVERSGSFKIAFFNQDLLSFETDDPIHEVVREAYRPLLNLQLEIEDLLTRMEQGDVSEKVLNDLAAKQDEFDTKGGSTIDASVHGMLSGLGFSETEQFQPYSTFSGGWRMRVLLAKMLLEEPDVLLLDEPTNHLDLPSIQWLENYLKSFKGSTVIVSHDRYFIDRMANKIVEISLKQLNVYAGNYSFYLQEKALRHEQAQAAYDNQQKFIEEQERFINRFKYKASKARQAQSRIKALERLVKLEAPEQEGFGLNIRFSFSKPSGKEVARLKDIHKAYGDKVIIEGGEATVLRGDKIALIGANGLGKSTLLRVVAGTEPHQGLSEMGHNVIPTFFAQHQLEVLDLKRNIYEEIDFHSRGRTEAELRSLLGSFMFSGDEIEKKIEVLSGGEKSRVALAKTLLSEANFLLLDEPTNHLDIPSIQVLVQALNAYEGTFVVVSHDRYFLQKVANKIWYIEDHKIKEYPGTYEEYERWREGREEEERVGAGEREGGKKVEEAIETKTVSDESAPRLSYKEQKQLNNRIKKLHRDVEKIETEITDLEGQKEAKLLEMASPEVAASFDKLTELQGQFDAIQETIQQRTAAWEEILMELEELEG